MTAARFKSCKSADEAVARLSEIYDAAVDRLRAALNEYGQNGVEPDPQARADGLFAYPEVRVSYAPERAPPQISRAYGKLAAPGVFAGTITQPELFADYLKEQLDLLMSAYEVEVTVGPSASDIPYPYVLESDQDSGLAECDPAELARLFTAPDLAAVGDELADGEWLQPADKPFPLTLFDAARVDYSLHRLRHYTGTPAEHVQDFVLFTNYHRYVGEFVRWAADELKANKGYLGISAPGGVVTADAEDPASEVERGAWRRHQMPAYHLMGPKRSGVTLVNIGVGPSNAKTITDHLAVMRTQCWLMIGHCGGLRHSQRLGDYVLAHAYLRRDGVLDDHLPLEIPVPPIAEIQIALQAAAEEVTGESGEDLKRRLRTGTVVTDSDRNWELRSSIEARRFNQSRAIAIDMESATIAANGFRFRVPYGTLLCVSDKPLHGELKLPGPASRFYQASVGQHLRIGLQAIEILRRNGAAMLHSRKLRAFDEPPFR